MKQRLTIFVHRASECLTDHESHGDGLICFSLLNGLAERGHKIYAFTNRAPIRSCHPGLIVKTDRHRVPANSLSAWEYSWRAEKWLAEIARTERVDLVWRMHPYHIGCPLPPKTQGRPLVIGPLFYGWPEDAASTGVGSKPRLGVGIAGLLRPTAERGWEAALDQAALILCATEAHAEAVAARHPRAVTATLPVMVDPPAESESPAGFEPRPALMPGAPVRLIFIANLAPNKNPLIFFETVKALRERGCNAEGIVLGDGPLRAALEAYCSANGMEFAVTFVGRVSNSEVYAHVRGAHFLLSTSYGEPYGRSIAEAMSVGTPCVCHRSGGPKDYIQSGRNGLLVEELTATAYRRGLMAALGNPNTWPLLSENALKTAADWRSDIILDRLEDYLERAVNPSASHSAAAVAAAISS
jgi:glycosyltransferase involved in cell wall biosynthesis